MNANEQIEAMRTLSQPAAAWLAGLSARSLRDTADLRRAKDGSYSGQDVVVWVASRQPRPDLSDELWEQLLTVADAIEASYEHVLVDRIDALKREKGEHVLLILLDILLERWRKEAPHSRERCEKDADPAERRRRVEEEERRFFERQAWGQMRTVVVCEVCAKLRRGRKWIKASPPAGFAVVEGLCPACE